MYKVGVVGHFGGDQDLFDGQTIKTKIIYRELEKQLGIESIGKVDTYNWRKAPFKLFCRCIGIFRKSKNLLLIPCTNGILVFVPLFFFLNLFVKRKLHYILVGAWLFDYFKKHRWLAFILKRFDCLYVEPKKMQEKLQDMGFSNVYQMPNCKDLTILDENKLDKETGLPLKFCIFSRIMRKKGVEDAVAAVEYVNRKNGRAVASLDIYGQVDRGYEERFFKLQERFSDEIRYCGCVPFDRSTETIQNYSVLLFPTLFYKEGHPGTVIDAFASGVPVVASEWENFSDMITEGYTGFGYPFGQNECLKDILDKIISDPSVLQNMRKHCLEEAKKYMPANALPVLLSNLE